MVSKYCILKILSKNGISQRRKVLTKNRGNYTFDRHRKEYIKTTRLNAVYRFTFIDWDDDPKDSDSYKSSTHAYDEIDGITEKPKQLRIHFRKRNYFPIQEVKSGALRGEETLLIIKGQAHWGKKGTTRYQVVYHKKIEFNGGLDS